MEKQNEKQEKKLAKEYRKSENKTIAGDVKLWGRKQNSLAMSNRPQLAQP
jgi:hypothetical protein